MLARARRRVVCVGVALAKHSVCVGLISQFVLMDDVMLRVGAGVARRPRAVRHSGAAAGKGRKRAPPVSHSCRASPNDAFGYRGGGGRPAGPPPPPPRPPPRPPLSRLLLRGATNGGW